jgi:hypothetical protein
LAWAEAKAGRAAKPKMPAASRRDARIVIPTSLFEFPVYEKIISEFCPSPKFHPIFIIP